MIANLALSPEGLSADSFALVAGEARASGRAALAAVLDPPPSSELFFVADGTGGHVFAVTYDEHLKNVARWRRIERQDQAVQKPKTKEP